MVNQMFSRDNGEGELVLEGEERNERMDWPTECSLAYHSAESIAR